MTLAPERSTDRATPTFRPASTTRSYTLNGVLLCVALLAGIAILVVASRASRIVVIVLAALPWIGLQVMLHRRRGSLYRFVNGPQVAIQADARALQLHIDDHQLTIPWQDIAGLRTGRFPWYSTMILDASGRELAVVPVAAGDPLVSEDRRSTIARLLVSNNPGQFIAVIGFGGDIRVRRAAADEVGVVEADLVAQTKLRARILVIVIVVITVMTIAAFLLRP